MKQTAIAVPAALVFLLALAGCAPTAPAPASSPTATSRLISLSGETWSGIDSTGDTTTFRFERDNTVTVTIDGETYHDSQDVWIVRKGTLIVTVYISDNIGTATYVGTFDPEGQVIDSRATTSVSDSSWTLKLARTAV